ncbi:MAG: TA system VapC family ribonuclease toxin [Actinomycetota bacterium]
MTSALLDINVLLALLDSDHVDHRRAHEWLAHEMTTGWASCAITENGFVRIISQPSYPGHLSPAQAVDVLRPACAGELHEFWPCTVSLLDDHVIDTSRLHGPRQVTDAYLLALATAHGGRFVTFDRSVSVASVRGATEAHLTVL